MRGGGRKEYADTEEVKRALYPADVETSNTGPRRTLISSGCFSGHEKLARAFLNAGWLEFIGPDVTTENSSLLAFLAVFFSLL
jgi:hypothetical protein